MQQDQVTTSKHRPLKNVTPDIFLLSAGELEKQKGSVSPGPHAGGGGRRWGGSQEGGDEMEAQIAFIWASVFLLYWSL